MDCDPVPGRLSFSQRRSCGTHVSSAVCEQARPSDIGREQYAVSRVCRHAVERRETTVSRFRTPGRGPQQYAFCCRKTRRADQVFSDFCPPTSRGVNPDFTPALHNAYLSKI